MSEQNLIDCNDENEGCDGGEMETAINFLKTERISIEAGYPYTARDGTCVHGIDSGVHVNGVKVFPPGENSLQAAVGEQPFHYVLFLMFIQYRGSSSGKHIFKHLHYCSFWYLKLIFSNLTFRDIS